MGLFGGSASTTKTVKPDARVTSMLKGILDKANSIDDFDFIQHDIATLNPQEQQAITNYGQSGDLNAIGGALAPRMMQGIEQATQLNKTYENAASNNIDANQVLANSSKFKNGVFKGVQQQAINAGGVAGKFGAVGRAAARRGGEQLTARNTLNPNFNNMAIDTLKQNQANTLGVADMQRNLANTNLNLGATGIDANQQALQNKLSTGNVMQGYQNALFANQQANEQGQNDFIWQKIANKQSVLGQVTPMAGYTETGITPGVSKQQQILGAGITGLGMASKFGWLGGSATQNAWNSYNKNGGQSGVAGPMPGGGNLSQGANQSQGWGSQAWGGITGALSGMVGGS